MLGNVQCVTFRTQVLPPGFCRPPVEDTDVEGYLVSGLPFAKIIGHILELLQSRAEMMNVSENSLIVEGDLL